MCSLEQNTQAGETTETGGSTHIQTVRPEVPFGVQVACPNVSPQDVSHGGAAAQKPPSPAQADEPYTRNTTTTITPPGAATGPPYAIPTSPVNFVRVQWPPFPTSAVGPTMCSSCSQTRLADPPNAEGLASNSAIVGNAAARPAAAIFVARSIRVASPADDRLPPHDAFPLVASPSSFSTSRVAVLQPSSSAVMPYAVPSLVRLGCQGCGKPEVARSIRVASPADGRLLPQDAFPLVASFPSFSTSRVAVLQPSSSAVTPCAVPSLVRLGCQGCGKPEVAGSCPSASPRAFAVCCHFPRATVETQTDIVSPPPEQEYLEDFDYGPYITRRIRLFQTDSVYEAGSKLQAEGIRKMKDNTLFVDPTYSEAKCYVNLLGWEIPLEDVAATPGDWEEFAIPDPPFAFPEPRHVFQPVLDPDVFLSNIPESNEAADETHASLLQAAAAADHARAKSTIAPVAPLAKDSLASPKAQARSPRSALEQSQLFVRPTINRAKGLSPASTRARNSLSPSVEGSGLRSVSAQSKDGRANTP